VKRRKFLSLPLLGRVLGRVLACPLAAATSPFHFIDVAAKAGLTAPVVYGNPDKKKYILETNGCGIAFFDYDHDGWLDIFVPGGSQLEGAPPGITNRLYKNNRDGTFSDVTKQAGLERAVWASGVCVGDYNNDGFDDLFLSCWGQNILYRNNGNGTFSDVTREAGLLHSKPEWGAGCTFTDYNRDGVLDLFVSTYLNFDLKTVPLPGATDNCTWKGIAVNCGPRGLPTGRNFLYRNNGDGTFTDVSEASGIAKVDHRYAMTAVAADFDDDGWPDIFVACDSTPSILYRNNRDGTFTDVALEAGVAYNEDGREQAGMGVAIGDVLNSGRLDIFKTHFADDTPILYSNQGNNRFEDMTSKAGFGAFTRYVGWGAGFADFDNDGFLDLLFVNGNVYPELEPFFTGYKYRNPRILLRNLGSGVFKNVSDSSGPGIAASHSSRGCAFGDFDNDGRIGVVIMNMGEPPSLLRNETVNSNRWLKLKLIGTKSNRSAIGARVFVTASGRRQRQEVLSQSSFYSQSDLRLHFGLGSSASADVEVQWPSGLKEVYRDVKSNQILSLKEGAKTP
jgi:enediyne biosynthesis protein E4